MQNLGGENNLDCPFLSVRFSLRLLHVDREELFRVIKKGKLVFHERYWSSVSEDAKDLLAQMLNVDPDARPQVH